jgi:hypothetical protein
LREPRLSSSSGRFIAGKPNENGRKPNGRKDKAVVDRPAADGHACPTRPISSIDPSFKTTPRAPFTADGRPLPEIIFKQLGINSIKVRRALWRWNLPPDRYPRRAIMIDLRNKEMGRILSRELQANFAVAGADLPRHLSELLDRLRESDDTTPQGANLADNSSSERAQRS